VNIYFKNNKLQKICNSRKEMIKAHGERCAKKLQQRLKELSAANTLMDISHLPPPRCHELRGSHKGIFSVDLVHPYRLLFVPVIKDTDEAKDGNSYIKERITEIKIIDIEDTHDGK
jgi:toxin HigB-1